MALCFIYYGITSPDWRELPLNDFLSEERITIIESSHLNWDGYDTWFIIKTDHIDEFLRNVEKCNFDMHYKSTYDTQKREEIEEYMNSDKYSEESFQGLYKNNHTIINIIPLDQKSYFYVGYNRE